MKNKITIAAVFTACLALCAAVWPQAETVGETPELPQTPADNQWALGKNLLEVFPGQNFQSSALLAALKTDGVIYRQQEIALTPSTEMLPSAS